jgi:hypothetical protein
MILTNIKTGTYILTFAEVFPFGLTARMNGNVFYQVNQCKKNNSS